MEYALYIATCVGAVALLLMMPRRGTDLTLVGGVLGACSIGALWLWLGRSLPEQLGMPQPIFAYYYVFSFIAIASAARVITHTKPVHAALWFVLVVLASSGLLLVLGAEFIAFAMIIIYGGAILVTYLFVIMLATESSESPAGEGSYETLAREPLGAVATGFLLLAVLLGAMFPRQGGVKLEANPAAAAMTDEQLRAKVLPNRPTPQWVQSLTDEQQKKLLQDALEPAKRVDNTERVGVDLFRQHPLGLELAGVILLVSLIGAVVIARQQVESEAPSQAG